MLSRVSQHPLRLLWASPDSLEAQTLADWEKESQVVTVKVGSLDDLFRQIESRHYDCLLLVESFNEVSASDTVAKVRVRQPNLPIVVLGREASQRAAVDAMREGASDYLLQAEIDASSLLQSVEDVVSKTNLSQQRDAAAEASRVAEKVLRERELQIRGFFDFSGVAMALVSPSGAVVRANPALRRLCGYDLAEAHRLTVSELVSPEHRERVSAGLALLLAREIEVCTEEVELLRKTGNPVWVDVSFALIADEDGVAQGYTLHATDISDRKATEAELERSERRFQELLAQAPIGIFETDKRGVCRFVNEKWSLITGRSYRESIGCQWNDSVHRDDLSPIAEEWSSAIRSHREFSKEFRFEQRDGSVVWVSGRISSTMDSEGRIVGYLGTVTDVTDRHLAEERVRRTGALLRGVLDNAPYIVVVTSNDGVIWDFNRGAEEHLGYTADEAIGQVALELLHVPSELKAFGTRLSREFEQPVPLGMPALAQADSGGAHSVWTYVRKDGTRFPVELAVREMRDPAGRLYGYVAIGRDITERLKRNQELVEARDQAERASAAKADFLARMSHEIRTPMNSVLGMTEVALQTSLTVEQRSYLELVQSSGQSLLRLINDILDFSRGEAHRLTLESVEFDLRSTFARCLRGLSIQSRQKGVELVLRVADDAPERVVGDSHRLQQVLINLVGNAVKFTAAGEIVVDVACAASGDGGLTTLYLEVSDTGPGVALEEQTRIFRAFAQEDTGIARRYGGTGLGLAICSQLVELMDGEIWLESEPGRGSCFHVTVALSAAAGPDKEEEPVSSLRWEKGALGLVLEENHKSREQTRQMLARQGYSTICVGSQSEALNEAVTLRKEGGRFAFAVLDLPTWGKRGRRFYEELTRLNGEMDIVCLSPSNCSDEERWAEHFVSLVKPILPGELYQALIDAGAEGVRHVPIEAPVSLRGDEVGPLRILVAEDNPTNQTVVSTMLDRLGHQAILVDDGQAALDRLMEESFDLVLMDLEMPVMGGIEAVQLLREREAELGRHTPVVALTAQAMQGDRETCLAAGMDDYLSKPLDMSSLLRVIDARAPSTRPQAIVTLPAPVEQFSLMPPPGVVDFSTLRSRIGDSPVALARVTELFERDSGRLLGELGAQIEAGGASKKSAAAHTLKGMLFNVCAGQAARLATELEASTKKGDWEAAREQISVLRREVRGAVNELQREASKSERPHPA